MYEQGRCSYGHIDIVAYGDVKIGSFCSIADGVSVWFLQDHRMDWITTYPFPAFSVEWGETGIIGHPVDRSRVLTIGNDVWIGTNATFLNGVTVGDGAVIGMGALVTKDVSPYTIVGGNPAHEIKKRFTFRQISALLQVRWWDWDDEKIKENIPLLCSDNIDVFIERNLGVC